MFFCFCIYLFIFYLQITQLEEFLEGEDIFFVYGSERINADDFELDFEGTKIF